MSPTPSTKSLSKKTKIKGAAKRAAKPVGKTAKRSAGKDRSLGLLPKQLVLQMHLTYLNRFYIFRPIVFDNRCYKILQSGTAFQYRFLVGLK
jgi:hypothetical protein